MSAVAVQTDVVELAQAMVRIPSLSGDEARMALFVQRRMEASGFTDIRVDDNGSVLGFVGPADAPIALLFDAHMDVVPPAGEWTVAPFEGVIRQGRLYGRGSADMKGGLAAALCAVARVAGEGNLTRRVGVSASVMEEVIEGHALSRVLDVCHPEAVVICEPSNLRIKVGQKGRMEILLTLKGSPAHAAVATPAANPIMSAAAAIVALQDLPLPHDDKFGEAIIVPTDIISDPCPSISLTPSSVTIRFDRRTLAGETEEVVLEQIGDCLHKHGIANFSVAVSHGSVSTYTGKTAEPKRHLPAWLLPAGHKLEQAMVKAVECTGLDASLGTWPFCTNGSESAGQRAIPTIGLGPGEEAQAHTTDESVAVHQLQQAEEIYWKLCRNLATEK